MDPAPIGVVKELLGGVLEDSDPVVTTQARLQGPSSIGRTTQTFGASGGSPRSSRAEWDVDLTRSNRTRGRVVEKVHAGLCEQDMPLAQSASEQDAIRGHRYYLIDMIQSYSAEIGYVRSSGILPSAYQRGRWALRP